MPRNMLHIIVGYNSRKRDPHHPLASAEFHDATVNPTTPWLTAFHLTHPAMPLPGTDHDVMRIGRRHWLGGLLRGDAAFFLSCIQL